MINDTALVSEKLGGVSSVTDFLSDKKGTTYEVFSAISKAVLFSLPL